MTMTIDAHHPPRYGLPFDNMSSYPGNQHPNFTNPWSSTTAPSSHALYAASPQVAHGALASNHMGLDRHSQQPPSRAPATTSASMAPYGSVPVTAASADLMSMSRMPHTSTAPSYAEPAYHTTAASPVHATYAASPTSYEPMTYPPPSVRHGFGLASDADPQSRSRGINDDHRGFRDALEASQGMLSMKFDTSNQETPRAGVYNNRGRGSGDSYGFPAAAHSTSSSVSSTTGYSPYSYGSIDSGASDYSTAGSDIESVGSRTLPRPQGLMPNQPPAPQSMMGQFSSKVSSAAQKKHKCKVCDKRFTRPSSLQTHMYSHTGEKPFKCEVENCGRHFSVVSNLRRHRKVHKGEARSEAGSEDQNQSD